ncbi:MAG: tRNA adenosine(34) deaminase TadA [Candidatus Binatia bacterium]
MNNSFSAGDAEDRYYMEIALDEAGKALAKDEVPVGAVVVCGGEVIGRGHNRREELQEPTGHAEILALREASSSLSCWRLDRCRLYVTLEPCIMCTGAILQARIFRLVFGCRDPKGGAVESLYRLCEDRRLNHHPAVTCGILERECTDILNGFFGCLRQRKKTHAKKALEPTLLGDRHRGGGSGGR